jgi:hypothetical protein
MPSSWAELAEAVRFATAGCRSVAVHAGHFLLHYEEAQQRLVPCVESELGTMMDEPVRREVAQFPELSWRLACRLIKEMAWPETCVLIIVNDVQYIPSASDRQGFFERYSRLPTSYIDIAREFDLEKLPLLTPAGLGSLDAPRPYFSERALRNRYNRTIKKLIKSELLPAGFEMESAAAGTTCLVDVAGTNRKVYCASEDADCAQEIAQVTDDIYRLAQCDGFVNLYPGVCREFIEVGSELSFSLYASGVSKIVNIGLPATGVASEEDLVEEAEVVVHHRGAGRATG